MGRFLVVLCVALSSAAMAGADGVTQGFLGHVTVIERAFPFTGEECKRKNESRNENETGVFSTGLAVGESGARLHCQGRFAPALPQGYELLGPAAILTPVTRPAVGGAYVLPGRVFVMPNETDNKYVCRGDFEVSATGYTATLAIESLGRGEPEGMTAADKQQALERCYPKLVEHVRRERKNTIKLLALERPRQQR